MAVFIENIRISDIPALEVSQVGAADHLPMVILVHGWSGHKEDMLFSGRKQLFCGFDGCSGPR